ncbi:hypothetical protein [Thermococcus sp.]|uniref:hypothetical protein n=1 Tax=Thermococcus sp. TaxID=35749 RepID=UPI0026215DB7|nr:hypothetical protein [Thermococcus sp.]
MAIEIIKLIRHNPWWNGEGWEKEDPNLSCVKGIIPRKEIRTNEAFTREGHRGERVLLQPPQFQGIRTVYELKLPDVSFPYDKPNVDEIFPRYEKLEGLFYAYILTGGVPEAVLDFRSRETVGEERYEEIIRLVLGEIAKSGKSKEIARELLKAIFRLKGNRVDYVTLAGELGFPTPRSGSIPQPLRAQG